MLTKTARQKKQEYETFANENPPVKEERHVETGLFAGYGVVYRKATTT